LDLSTAAKILEAALAYATEQGFKPMAVGVIDARGALKCFTAQDGTSLKRGELALAKANGAVAMGMGSRALMKRAAGLFHCRRHRRRWRLAGAGARRGSDQGQRRHAAGRGGGFRRYVG
jgi:hypothetical protein